MFFPLLKIENKNELYSFLDLNGNESNVLDYLSKINIFVGENNCGKSLFLRYLVSNKFAYSPNPESITQLNHAIETMKNNFNEYLKNKRLPDFHNFAPVLNEIAPVMTIDENFNYGTKFEILKQQIVKLKKASHVFTGNSRIYHTEIGNKLDEIFYTSFEPLSEYIDIDDNLEDKLKSHNFKKIYIPILRGTRPINFNDDVEKKFDDYDLYRTRTLVDYFGNNEEGFEIFTGLNVYTKVKSHLLGDLHQRDLIKGYEEYLSTNFFDSKDVALIPKEGSDVLSIKIGAERERPIYELGDGLQSIIILTLPLFLNKDEDVLFFIEEPEQYLHPGLQRKLLEILMDERFKTFQYFMTTHSNHFLDITLDYSEISIFGFRKQFDEECHDIEQTPSFLIENLSHGDYSLLELLGVKNSSVFLSNCTIWVEGITDRLYLKSYFDLYLENLEKEGREDFKYLREDYHYSYVEYAGNNIEHWSFLDDDTIDTINAERLCGKLLLIADKDAGKDERHKKLEDTLGENFYRLNCKEIENLISKKVLLDVINDYEIHFKAESVDIQDFEEDDYQEEYLGAFIESKLNSQKRPSYKAESGTIKDKMTFCKKAISYTNEYDDLSDEAIELCEKIYKFIMENNS